MKKTILLLAGIICLCSALFGCGNQNDGTFMNGNEVTQSSVSVEEEHFSADSFVAESENQTENSNVINADELADAFGISVSLPESTNWIANRKYYLQRFYFLFNLHWEIKTKLSIVRGELNVL